ncbi:MAG: ribosome biogenesis GTPase YlqF [Clostridia bacterium]
MDINWYPGHMAKTKRLLAENLKISDIVIELLDARVPFSSQNPDFKNLFNNKKRVKAFNKADLADERISMEWQSYYESKGIPCIFINSRNGAGFKKLLSSIEENLEEKFARDASRGIRRRPIHAMVVGIPNVGKSTFINTLAGKAAARTGDRPGVTRDKQWIKINSKIHLLDTPGILWPKLGDRQIGLNLALTGAIKDEIMDVGELAVSLIDFLSFNYRSALRERYGISSDIISAHEILEAICLKRGFLSDGGNPDVLRAAETLLDEFRGGLLGRITLEVPPAEQNIV